MTQILSFPEYMDSILRAEKQLKNRNIHSRIENDMTEGAKVFPPDPPEKPNTFQPISCHACAVGNAVMSLCNHCRKYYCALHWNEHICEAIDSADAETD